MRAGPEADSDEPGEPGPVWPLRWLRRALPAAFLGLVAVLAVRELRGLDIQALRTVLQALTLPRVVGSDSGDRDVVHIEPVLSNQVSADFCLLSVIQDCIG